MIGKKKYWIKEGVSKEKIGKFVNSKLKDLGFQTGKIQYKQRARQPVAPRAIAPRAFRKTKEQEVEDLQRRREPESIELFQLTKDSLVDLAKKAGVISPSTLTKLQLIQAIQKTKITKEDVEKVVEGLAQEKKQKEEKLQEFVDNASQMAKKTLPELLELRDRYIEERKQDRSLPDLKLPQGRPTKEKVLQLILRFQDAKFRKLEEEREAQESYERKQEEQRRQRVMRREEELETQRREALEGKESKAEQIAKTTLRTIDPELKRIADEREWKQVLKMASDAERKENKEFNKQFDDAVSLFQSDMEQIEQKEREEKKRIKDEKVRKATEFANRKLQERAFELFNKNVKELKEEKALESKADTFRTQKAKERIAKQLVLNKEIKEAETYLNKIPRDIAKAIVRAGEKKVEEGKLSKQNFLPTTTALAMETRKTIKKEKRKQKEVKRKQEEEEFERELQIEEEKEKQELIKEIMKKESDFFSKLPERKAPIEFLGTENIAKLKSRLKKLNEAIERKKSDPPVLRNPPQRPPPRASQQPPPKPVSETVIQGRTYPIFESTTISGKPLQEEEVKQPPRLNTITKFSQAPPPTTVEPEIEQAEPVGGDELEEPDVPIDTQNAIQASTPLPRSNPQDPAKRRGERGGVKKKKQQASVVGESRPLMEEPEISGTGHKHNADNLPEGKGIDNHTIDRFLSKFGNEYLGCIACDEIPSKIYPKIRPRTRAFFVMNTEPSYKGGLHWVCLFMDARPHGSSSIEYFDSFADPIPPRLQQDIKGIAERLDAKTYLKLKENRIKFQCESSDNCGHFCMEFICDRMRGKPFPEASKFNDSVRGEDEVNRWKTMNGFGFLPSFGMIRSALQRPQVPSVIKNAWNRAGEKIEQFRQQFFPAKKLPAPVQVLFDKYKNNKVISAQIRREPIFAIIDKVINLISGGKFDEAKKQQGYDKMFHLSLIITLDNGVGSAQGGVKLLIEKNERINMTTSWKDTDKVEYLDVGPINSTPTLEQFFSNTEKAIGDHRFFTYNAFDQNCQRFISDLLQSNNSLTNNAQNFILQDAQSIVKKMPFFVSKIAQFATDTAGRVKQFFGFGVSKNNNNFTESSRHTRSIQRRKRSHFCERKQRFQNFMKKIKNVV